MSPPDLPIVRIQLRYLDEATFLQRFAPNVTRGGIFLASRAPHPIGSVIAFEVTIMQGPPLLAGTGKVTWVREFNPTEPHRAHGMGVQFLDLVPGCRPMLDRLLAHKNLPPRLTPVSGVAVGVDRGDGHRLSARDLPDSLDGDPSSWIDDQGLRQAIERARSLACKVEELDALLVRDRASPSLDEARAELPRLLDPRRQ